MDYARASLLLREWGMNDAGSLARVSLAPHRLVRAQRRNLAADHLVNATASLGRHWTNGTCMTIGRSKASSPWGDFVRS